MFLAAELHHSTQELFVLYLFIGCVDMLMWDVEVGLRVPAQSAFRAWKVNEMSKLANIQDMIS